MPATMASSWPTRPTPRSAPGPASPAARRSVEPGQSTSPTSTCLTGSRGTDLIAGGHPSGGVLAYDVVGLGALNVDLIAAGPDPGEGPDDDNETVATRAEIRGRIATEQLAPCAFLGGSAFNAMEMLAQLDTGLRLGMVGIA